MASNFTPEQALALTAPTEAFLCPITANKYCIEFYQFAVRDMATNKVLFSIGNEPEETPNLLAQLAMLPEDQANQLRTIKYKFPKSMLTTPSVGAKLVFGVSGDAPVQNFRMIERHYFRNVLIKSFDFQFGFCIPHSTNTWESIYDMPALNPEWVEAIIANPYETTSDSFYFVGGELVMHNKAYYAYDAPEN